MEKNEEKNQKDEEVDLKLIQWYIDLKAGKNKKLNLKDCINHLNQVKKSVSGRMYFKIFIEIIRKEKSIFEKENVNEFLIYFKDQLDYITGYGINIEEKLDLEFPNNCRFLTFKIATKVEDFNIFDIDYLRKLFQLILFYIPSLFTNYTLMIENKVEILIKTLNSIKKISSLYNPDNIHLISYINELIILSCYKLFEFEEEYSPDIIYILCSLFANQIFKFNDNISDNHCLDLNLKNIDLCLLYLLYTFSRTDLKLKNSDVIIEIPNENNLNEKKSDKRNLIESIEYLISKCYDNCPHLINSFLDIISGDFFKKISLEKGYNSNNYINFILSLNFSERNELNLPINNREIAELNLFKENLYSFILSEDFGINHLNIKEMIIIGLLSLYKIYPLYFKKNDLFLYIPYDIFFNKIKNILKEENCILKQNTYCYIISFISYLIKNYTKEINDSFNEIIEILIFFSNRKDEKNHDKLIDIIKLIMNLLLFEDIGLNIKKFIELCENSNSDSIIINSFICDLKMSIQNANYKEDSINFFKTYIFEQKDKKDKNLIESNFCMATDKLKYNIRYGQGLIKKNSEEILSELFSYILDFAIEYNKLNQYISLFITECILCMNYSSDFLNIMNKLFFENYNKENYNEFKEKTLYDIFFILNYSSQKEKMEKFLELLLNGNNFDKNINFIETILINLIVTQDGLVHIRNDNKYIIEFQYSPIPILTIEKNENNIFLFFNIQNIIKRYFDKTYHYKNYIVYEIILKNIENAITLNKDLIYFIYAIFIDSQTLLKNFSKSEGKIFLKIFSNLNYYFSWSPKFFLGKKEEINSSLYLKEVESTKDLLFQNLFQKMKQNLFILYFFPIYQFYVNSLYENSIDEISYYSNSPQINNIIIFLSLLYVSYKNNIKILINILNSYFLFKDIIKNCDVSIENQVLLILSLIAFPENEKYLIETFKSELATVLPKEKLNTVNDDIKENEEENKEEMLFIKDYAKNLLFIYFSCSKVKNEFLNYFKNLPDKNNINEFKYFYKLMRFEIELNIKKRNTCSLKKLEEILSNKNSFGRYIIIEETLLIAYPEDDNKVTLIILNECCNFQYLIEIPKPDSNSLSDQEQIKKLNKLLNNNDINIENEKTFSNSKYVNQPQYLLFQKENISKIILQFLADIPIDNKFSKIEDIHNIDLEKLNSIKNILKTSIFKICNVNIIYNPYSFYQNINEKELFDNNKDNFSKEFLEFLSELGDLKIDKNSGEISLFYEDFVNKVNLYIYDSIKNNEKRNNILLISQIEIIWMDYPNQSINDYLKKVNNSYNKIYIFIYPRAKNLYKVQLRVRTILNEKDETKNKPYYSRNQILKEKIELSDTQKEFIDFKYIEQYLDDFMNQYFIKDFMINISSESGKRYFKNLIILLNTRINYIKENLECKPFITIEEKILSQILQLNKNN